MTANRDQVLAALKQISDPVSGSDIVSAGVVRGLNVEGETVRFVLEIDPSKADAYGPARDAAEAAVQALDGITEVSAVLTAHSAKSPPDLKPHAKAKPKGPQKVPGVNHIIAIASGKGGVGKSTVSSNLACALAAEGRRVGLLDADVYGPSQPRMLGVSGRPSSPDGKNHPSDAKPWCNNDVYRPDDKRRSGRCLARANVDGCAATDANAGTMGRP